MKIGFCGCGNMGSAILGGLIESKIVVEDDIFIYEPNDDNIEKIHNSYGQVNFLKSNIDVVDKSEIIFIAVKPYMYKTILEDIKDKLNKEKIVITIAPGISIKEVKNIIENKAKVVRTMPNTPALVRMGMTAVSFDELIEDSEKLDVISLLESFGEVEVINEGLMDHIPAVSGSSPAYVYIMIEAMADGAVKAGIPRDKAYKFAAQSVMGAAKMVIETGKHPGELKDAVCSPGGTTIKSVAKLEEKGFRSAIIEAMKECYMWFFD